MKLFPDRLLGIIAVADKVRPAAAKAIARLKRLGIEQIVMLTGDNSRTAHSVAQQVGVDQRPIPPSDHAAND